MRSPTTVRSRRRLNNRRRTFGQIETLERRDLLAADPIISEYLSVNSTGITDQYGETSDWIEIYNRGDQEADLEGWYLTNNANDLKQWELPAETLPAGEYLIVFASNRDESIAGQELHTNFELSASGEYLAFVQPDGVTVANEFAASPQFTDISFGHEMSVSGTLLVAADADIATLIPSDGSLGTTWTDPGFATDNSWITESAPGVTSTFPVGFDSDTAVPNLISNWPLDEAAGTSGTGSVADASGDGRDGTPTGNMTFASGGANAFTFTGVNFASGSIDVPHDAALNGDSFTAMAWVRPESTVGYGSVFTSRFDNFPNVFGYILYNDSNGRWSFWTGAGNGAGGWATLGGPAVVTNTWTHVAISFDANSNAKTMWIDGQVAASTAGQGYGPNTVRDLHIGGGGDLGNDFRFDGTIDDVAVFDAALDQADIQAYMDNGVPESASTSYGDLIETDIATDMEGTNASAYIRSEFTVAAPSVFTDLRLDVQYDDGFVAYLNGQEIARRNAPAVVAWNSPASAPHPDSLAIQFETIDVGQFTTALVAGTNVLAFHGLNIQAADKDFLLAADLTGINAVQVIATTGYLSPATPETINPDEALSLGPLISDVSHTPTVPTSAQPIIVTAQVDMRLGAITDVSLNYRTMYGAESILAMVDDGTGDDFVSGDGIFTATIPAGVANNGQMLRYRIDAEDDATNTSRFPGFLDQNGNRQSPEYLGTVVTDSEFSATLPVFQWFTQDVNAAHTRPGTRTSVFFNGRFYDNVFARQRGGFTNAAASQKFVFNKGNEFYLDESHDKLDEININGQGSDSSYMRQSMGFTAHQNVLGAGATSFISLLTVNGAVDRVGIVIEQVDEQFLKRNGYDDDGDLYKFVQRSNLNPVLSGTTTGVEKKTGDESDFTSINALVAGLNSGTANQQQLFARDALDIPQIINYLAVRSVQQQADDVRKNFYMYVDAEGDGLWRIFPWDLDWTFEIVGGHGSERTEHPYFGTQAFPTNDGANQWNVMYDELLKTDEVQRMLLRRMRTLMDEFYRGPSGGTTWFDQYVNTNFAAADPHLPGNVNAAVSSLQNSIQNRRNDLYNDLSNNVPGTSLAIPAAQIGNPDIDFGAFEFAPLSGNQDEEYIELVNNNSDDVDISGWRLTGGVDFTFAPGTVIPANESLYVAASTVDFRARTVGPTGGQNLFIVGDYSGHLSNFGETVELVGDGLEVVDTLTYPGNPSDAQQFLRLTELNYNPHAPTANELLSDPTLDNDDLEYIEFVNTGTEILDLTGVQITSGVTFTFGNLSLNPDEHILVVKDQTAFEIRYGASMNIAGQFASGSLDNSGESVKVEDDLNGTIHDFTFNDSGDWPAAADGAGGSLEIVDTEGNYDNPFNWRSSTEFGGNPDTDGSGPAGSVVINEVLSHTDAPQVDSIELYNPTGSDVNIGGWFLSDSVNQLAKYQFPANTMIIAGQYLVIDETAFNPTPTTPGPLHFALSGAHGDDLWLVETNGVGDIVNFIDDVEFGAQANGESWGRWPNGIGELYPQIALTLDDVNSGPRVGPLVIGEVMYHPTDPDGPGGIYENDLEFVEIYNPTGSAVVLTNWRLNDAVDFGFPDGLSIPDGGRIVVLSFNPTNPLNADRVTAFRDYYALDPSIQLIGGYSGQLNNAGERLQLLRPDSPPIDEPDFTPLLLEDEVNYRPTAPWPTSPDGGGSALVRGDSTLWGNEAASWIADAPTPGSASNAPEITDVAINADQINPPDLAGKGPQPTSWEDQRSWLTSITVTFNEPVIATADDLVLTNLGQNAPADADTVFDIQPNHLSLSGNVLTLSFAAAELTDGVYQLDVLETVTDLGGAALDGDRDGNGGDLYHLVGNSTNRFYRMESDWNGDTGVSVFDFTTFSYWFGQAIGPAGAPAYADLNEDSGVSVFDFTGFSNQFGEGVIFPIAFRGMVAPTGAEIASLETGGSGDSINDGELQQAVVRLPNNWDSESPTRRNANDAVFGQAEVDQLEELFELLATAQLDELL
jgi:hypothetical protein